MDMDMERAPSFREMLPCLIFYQLMDDLFFFCHHWLLHTPLLYSIHKMHHEYTTAVSIAGYYGHYLEFLGSSYLAGIYGTIASYFFGPAHISMGVIWSILRNWDAFNSHSGYTFSWAPLQLIPFCTCDDYHSFHHSRNMGTLGGPLRIWDTVFGLNEDYWAFKEKK
jgi:sterol desaturase/sphingolipid hydroxylase (fatty acid hydroxylase superfamily)